jgi:hypothetical protein
MAWPGGIIVSMSAIKIDRRHSGLQNSNLFRLYIYGYICESILPKLHLKAEMNSSGYKSNGGMGI